MITRNTKLLIITVLSITASVTGAILATIYMQQVAIAQNRTGSTGAGFYIASRTSSATLKQYKNGSQTDSSTSNNSVGVPPRALFLLARNHNGGADNFVATTISASFIGSGLDATQANNLTTRVNTYMTAWGVNTF